MENKENQPKALNRQSHRSDHNPPIIPLIIPNDSVVTTYAIGRLNSEPVPARIEIKELIGSGSFGRVYKARLDDSDEVVALKQILHNPKFCQREAEIMGQLEEHTNIVRLIMHSCVTLGIPPISYIILIMEYMPMTLLDYINYHRYQLLPAEELTYVRILSYQVFRGLGYLHSLGICHRDIKPENLLIDHQQMLLKLSDFGSAKHLVPDEPSLSYICSRLYRAPELFAHYDLYGCAVDIWSAGCVLAELLKGSPLFLSNKHDRQQLMFIVSLLGSEGLERAPEIRSMCGTAIPFRCRPSWDQLLGAAVPQDLADLLNSCFVYQSSARIAPMMACGHCSYDELRIMEALGHRMPNGHPLPPLFNFSSQELGIDPKLWVELLPLHLSQVEDELPVEAVFPDVKKIKIFGPK
ncbi:glycogen synthase kinase-3 alpha [Drosophila gunungcola]|uniref:glycogen synthase kinase-3 alpha n=1 Tax=Drosophila gunungcola TaxID=103775 RepID=UPI0022E47942|nr:glycogen synthase kinase-3 alpha [Drosophila gunungcola]